MAAGLTVARDRIEPAMARLAELLARQGAGAGGPRDLHIDSLIMPGAATTGLVEDIERAGPFGQSAPAPRFALPSVEVRDLRRMGEAHLKVVASDGLSGRVEAVAFGAFEGPLGPFLDGMRGRRVHLAGRLDLNHWQGRTTVQLRLEDAAPA
jgi:single-stranded-DNA-specific exonuclease